jgi:hypothetical protein
MATYESDPLQALPVAQSGRLIAFDTAQVISLMIYPPRPGVLVVSGHKPYPTMRVELIPLVYIRRPEYWGIEVVGFPRRRGRLIPAPPAAGTPYTVELDLAGVIGTLGIEVIGANRTEQIPLATEDATRFIGAVEDGRFRRMFPPGIHERFLRLTTVGVKDEAQPETGEIDLAPYEGSILKVLGQYRDGWVYSAMVVEEVPDSILAIVARQVFPDPAQ